MHSAGSRSLEGIGLQSQARGLAESNRDGLDCLGTKSTWVVTDAVRASLVRCSSKLCDFAGHLTFLHLFCPQTSQTTDEVSWGQKKLKHKHVTGKVGGGEAALVARSHGIPSELPGQLPCSLKHLQQVLMGSF